MGLWYYVIVINKDHINRKFKMSNETEVKLANLPANASTKDIVSTINQIIQIIAQKRDRGPASTRSMTEADVDRFVSGDLKDEKTGKVAEMLGLSYGQVYSARNGFTFKKKSK